MRLDINAEMSGNLSQITTPAATLNYTSIILLMKQWVILLRELVLSVLLSEYNSGLGTNNIVATHRDVLTSSQRCQC